jgi:hypothetical protein
VRNTARKAERYKTARLAEVVAGVVAGVVAEVVAEEKPYG